MPSPQPIPAPEAAIYLGVAQSAAYLGIAPTTIKAWSDAGRIQAHRTGPDGTGHRRYCLSELVRFKADHLTPA